MRPLLALAAGQDLGERASRRVWGHLAECMDCRRRYTEYLELRSALAELEPSSSGTDRATGVDGAFFRGLREAILNGIQESAPAPRGRRAWAGAAAAATLFLVGALAIRSWLPQGDGLLHREPIEAVPPSPSSQLPSDFGTKVTPLSYPQGLGARRQIDLLFEEESGFEVTPASYGQLVTRER